MPARLVALACLLFAAACASPEGHAAADYEAFRDALEREPFEGGVWIYDGDLAVDSEKRLRDVWEHDAWTSPGSWGPTERRRLRYCVSDAFGSRHGEVVVAMAEAAASWEAVADVDFHHIAPEDGRCDLTNEAVLFDVRPVTGRGYRARAFFPHASRVHRSLLVSVDGSGLGAPSLDKVLEHQLGHVLGLDHTRIGAAIHVCDGHDSESVMADLECAGAEAPEVLGDRDVAGVVARYGPPSAAIAPAPPGRLRAHEVDGLLAAGARVDLAPVAVAPTSRLFVALSGRGDLDLYVRFDASPTATAYDCRPWGPLADERCELEVPAGVSHAHVSVVSASPIAEDRLRLDDYRVQIESVSPETPLPRPPTPIVRQP